MEFFLCNKHKIVVKLTMHQEQDSAISKALLEKFLHQWDHKYWFWILQIIAFLADIGHTITKQPLSNFEPRELGKYEQPSGLRLVPIAAYTKKNKGIT